MNCCHPKVTGMEPAEKGHQVKSSVLVRCCVASLRSYKKFISPFLPPSCRFTPTCSEYAMEAVQRHGVIRGLAFSAFRLLRCHPFAKGGYDPVK
ncbi:MAG: membrane protein insertion efficiency factor YidD [Desulfobulbaceae bacterium]|nr:membrane protein insertion efficiency factor YidD [Desulfobulbaceae bacterium]